MHRINLTLVAMLTWYGSLLGGNRSVLTVRPQLSICLYDRIPVSGNILQIGKKQVTSVFGDGGIDVHWIDVRQAEGDSAQEECAGIHLVLTRAHSGASTTRMAKGATTEGVGWAFYDRVESFVDSLGRSLILHQFPEVARGQVLGAVMTHEIGHVLKLNHSRDGIMRARLSPADFGVADYRRLRFTREDAQSLVARLRIKMW